MNRRLRRVSGGYAVELWTNADPDDRQRDRLSKDDVRETRAADRASFDSSLNSFPNTLEAVPFRGELRVGQPADFMVRFLAAIAVPLREERMLTRVGRIAGDTVHVDVTYSTDPPPMGLGGREVQSLNGTVEFSLSTGRPARLKYNSSGIDWHYRFGGRVEPEEFTDDIQCEWSYYRDAPVRAPP